MDTYTLPWLTNSGLSTWIARGRARIAAAKLKVQLFDKRLELFDAVRAFLSGIVLKETVTSEEVDEYRLNVADAAILFDEKTAFYLESIRMKAAQLLLAQGRRAETPNMAPDQRSKLADLEAQVRSQITSELKAIAGHFKPFLTL
jgi:hypothetical protein